MTLHQGLAFAIIGSAMAMFAWGRFRYDLISLVALLVAVLSGVVAPKQAFSGFSSDVVVIIACALVISAAITRSGVIEPLVAPLVARLRTPATQVPVLAGVTALFAMVAKNVGALAAMMPIAIRMGRSERSSPSLLLMPMSFLSLLGGLVTLVGTSTNIIVSQVREDVLGEPFSMFDFAPVGLTLTAIGLVTVSVAWRLLPRDRTPQVALGEVQAGVDYATEAALRDDWPDSLATVADLGLEGRGVTLTAILDAAGHEQRVTDDAPLAPGFTLLLKGDDQSLGALFQQLPLAHSRGDAPVATGTSAEAVRTIEAVIEPGSRLAGRSVGDLHLQRRHGVKLLAVSRRAVSPDARLSAIRLAPGDVLILEAGESRLGVVLGELGLLPLAERPVAMGAMDKRWLPVLVLVVAMGLVVARVLPVAVAFFAAAVVVVAVGALSLREAYNALEPEVLILIGALVPLGEAMQHNGATQLVAQALTSVLSGASPMVLLGGILLAAMAAAPFLHNAPTVLILAPIAVTLARGLHLNPDAFLMAVATGAGSDFLTPIGHQCNTLVRGPGGYRFGDYARLGVPLSLVVLFVGTPLIAAVWGLTV